MAFRLYIVPVVGVGTKSDLRRPKYFDDGTLVPRPNYSAMDYGFEPWMVVGANLSVSDDATVVGQADAMAIPFNMDVLLTAGNVTTVQTKLEAINIPAGWVTTSLTWRQVVRIVLGMVAVMQRFAGLQGVTRIFAGGVTLNSTIGSLSQGVRNNLTLAATSQGLSVSGISGATTIRAALKILADQFTGRTFVFGGVSV